MPHKTKEGRAAWRAKNIERIRANARRGYQNNRSTVRAKQNARYAERRAWFDSYKATLSCKECGEGASECLDFHHRDGLKPGDERVSILMVKGATIERIQEEIAKCDPLCCNCHRKLHWDESH